MQPEKKLTSIRLDTDIIEAADKFVASRRYWKRSEVLNNVLKAVFANFSEGEIYDMVRSYSWQKNVVNVQFEITDELRTPKPRDNG